jgi:threonine aldolase
VNFTSDNCYGASPEILDAMARANEGAAVSYGDDRITRRLTERFSALFERDVAVFPVLSGTAANALALATLVPPHGAILCHAMSHIAVDECGAPELFTHGAKLALVEGDTGKLTPAATQTVLARFEKGSVHHPQPATISITQASEFGTVYAPDEVAALAKLGLKLHMDGARFANALVSLGCAPADITWRAGVDVLSFGATKNGAIGAEAVVFFDPKEARDFAYRRKKSGHLVSKMRFVSAQLEAYLADDLWLRNARRANALAARLAEGLGTTPAWPVQANEVFVHLPDATTAKLRQAGARFYDWEKPRDGKTLVRLVTSFATRDEDVEKFISLARG